ncbi:MAG: hypothetical protein IKG17_10725 [Mogibacterium sp.]|jgi:hypothetical protein|nr:hypothetical protein [Mogibacterium sp.]
MKIKKKPGLAVLLCFLIALFALMPGCSGNGANESESGSAEPLSSDAGAGIADAVPGLEKFMGGWGSLDSPHDDCNVAEFMDENGKLKVNFAAISGGGYYVIFEAGDISFDGDKMTCVNGLVATEAKEFTDGIMVAAPSETTEGGYTFVVSNEGGEIHETPDYVYIKVGNTREELQEWINEHHESL